jgi:antitoxin ChpS
MQLEIGDQLSLEMSEGELVVRPLRSVKKRYKLSELLEGKDIVAGLNADLAWAMEGDPTGHEIS